MVSLNKETPCQREGAQVCLFLEKSGRGGYWGGSCFKKRDLGRCYVIFQNPILFFVGLRLFHLGKTSSLKGRLRKKGGTSAKV